MYYSESGRAAAYKYKSMNIKRVPLDMQLEDYARLKSAADAAGEKVNQYIKNAIFARMARDAAGDPARAGAGDGPGGAAADPAPDC